MRRVSYLVLFVLGLAPVAAAQPKIGIEKYAAAVRETRDQAAVKALIKEMFKTSTEANPDALDKFFHPDVTIVDGNGFTKGYQAYKERSLRPQIKTMVTRPRIPNIAVGGHSVGDIYVTVSNPANVAWATYTYNFVTQIDNKETEIWGVGTMVLRKVKGQWLIAHSQSTGRPRENWGTGPTR